MSTSTDTDGADAPARRLTLSQIVEKLLQRGSAANSSVTLTRNAKGDTQIEVVVRTDDETEVRTITEAQAAATATYDALTALYPLTPATPKNGGTT